METARQNEAVAEQAAFPRDHQTLMNSAYDKMQSLSWATRFEALTNLEKLAVMLGNMNQQIENGGVIQWIDNRYAAEAAKHLVKVFAATRLTAARGFEAAYDVAMTVAKIGAKGKVGYRTSDQLSGIWYEVQPQPIDFFQAIIDMWPEDVDPRAL